MTMNIKIKEHGRMPKPSSEPRVNVEEFVTDLLESRGFTIDPEGYGDVSALVAYKNIRSNISIHSEVCIYVVYDHDVRALYVRILTAPYRMATRYCKPRHEWDSEIFSSWDRITEQNVGRYIDAAEKSADLYIQALQAVDIA